MNTREEIRNSAGFISDDCDSNFGTDEKVVSEHNIDRNEEGGSGSNITVEENASFQSQYQAQPKPGQILQRSYSICKNLVNCLDYSELLKFRMVSSNWEMFLNRRFNTSEARLNFVSRRMSDGNVVTNTIINGEQRTFEELTKLMTKSFENSQAHLQFPCRRFGFYEAKSITDIDSVANNSTIQAFLSNRTLQTFLSSPRVKIVELTFKCNLVFSKDLETEITENIVNLISNQQLSLEQLFIESTSKTLVVSDHFREYYPPLTEADEEYQQILREYSSSNFKTNNHLRHLKLPPDTPPQLVEIILLLAPNLESLQLNSSNPHYFVEPKNRLRLLKHLRIVPRREYDVEVYEKVAKACDIDIDKEIVKLISITLCLWTRIVQDVQSNLEMIERSTRVVNTLLASSWDSLRRFYWNVHPGDLPLLRFPLVMPSVSKLCFQLHMSSIGGVQTFIQKGSKWSSTFPNLKMLLVISTAYTRRQVLDLISWFNFDAMTTLTRVSLLICSNLPVNLKEEDALAFSSYFVGANVRIGPPFHFQENQL